MINSTEGKTYQERLQCLKLWTLEWRRNRQDLIEVFKICNGLSRIRLNELFTLDDNIKGTRMWANAQPDGRPAEHRWRPLFNAAKFG